jgi:diphthamide biosynthesis protein 7
MRREVVKTFKAQTHKILTSNFQPFTPINKRSIERFMASPGQQIVSRQSLMLDLPPSCLEFSPLYPSYFLVGTYNLQKSDKEEEEAHQSSEVPQKRNGSIVVYNLVCEDIVILHTEERPSAVLDLRFQIYPGKQDIVGAVSSTGTLEVFRFAASHSASPNLTHLSTLRIPGIEQDVLFLQLAWHHSIPDTVAITTSQGGVHILQLGPNYATSKATNDPIITHTLEAWCVAIWPNMSTLHQSDNTPSSFTIYSGGDDSVLQYATCSIGESPTADGGALQIELPYASMKVRGHGAGVTAILPLSSAKNLVVTGSYDDHIRVFSIEPLHNTYGVRKTKLLAEANLGGGVWRLGLIKTDDGGREDGSWRALILASCMHAGSRIVEVRGHAGSNSDVELEVKAAFEEHKSMNYASGFQPGSEARNDEDLVCVSTSFYDKLLCLWRVKLV